jgi:hypothetical protein
VFWVGPYAHLPPGRYNAIFQLKEGLAATGQLTVDVSLFVGGSTRGVLASRTLGPSSFSTPDVWTPFGVGFTLDYVDAATASLEFRGSSVRGGPFYLDYVVAAYIGPP